MNYDAVIAGAGPAGLSAAESIARNGYRVLVLEQNKQIGSPVRTTGGTFIKDMKALGIPERLYHSVHRCRFLSPANSAAFEYRDPVLCIMDVTGVYQYLAEKAADAGAQISVATTGERLVRQDGFVSGVETKGRLTGTVSSRITIDATGHRAALLREAGVHEGWHRFGVGSEYDLYAPNFDRDEAVLIVGSQIAPFGYAWFAPWGVNRVRAGVGLIHPDTADHPDRYLDKLLADADLYGCNLRGAQPVEYHYGLIPSEGLASRFVGNGILGVGDSAGQASTLVGEGIRWAIKAGRMAGTAAANALARNDVSEAGLRPYQEQWNSAFATNLKIAHEINKRIATYSDAEWDRKTDLLKLLTPGQFDRALQTDFSTRWALDVLRSHPQLIRTGLRRVAGYLGLAH